VSTNKEKKEESEPLQLLGPCVINGVQTYQSGVVLNIIPNAEGYSPVRWSTGEEHWIKTNEVVKMMQMFNVMNKMQNSPIAPPKIRIKKKCVKAQDRLCKLYNRELPCVVDWEFFGRVSANYIQKLDEHSKSHHPTYPIAQCKVNLKDTEKSITLKGMMRYFLSSVLTIILKKSHLTFEAKKLQHEMNRIVSSAWMHAAVKNHSDYYRNREVVTTGNNNIVRTPDEVKKDRVDECKNMVDKVLKLLDYFLKMSVISLKGKNKVYIRNSVMLFCGESGGYIEYHLLYATNSSEFITWYKENIDPTYEPPKENKSSEKHKN